MLGNVNLRRLVRVAAPEEDNSNRGREETEMNFSRRPRLPLRLLALVVLSLGLLFSTGSAEAIAPGTVVAWGCVNNDGGQCSVPSDLTDATAISARFFHSLALRSDGTVVAWGCGFNADWGQCNVPNGLSGVTAISAGYYHSLALRSDGTVVAWGCGANFGQCDVPSDLSGVVAISAGETHSLALKGDGTVVAWGCPGGGTGQCNVPLDLSDVIAISANRFQSLALKNDGTVVAWGCVDIDFGQCNVPNGLSGVTAIAAGAYHSLAVKSDGTVVAWGCGGDVDAGQCTVPSGLSGVIAVEASDNHSLALKGNGTVVAWGCGDGFDAEQCNVPSGLSAVTAIAGGTWHSLALVGPSPQVYYLHGSGSNPPALTLDNTAPNAPNAKFRDSASLRFTGGNPWKEIGTWAAAPAGSAQTLTALSDLNSFLGLKNSDDQGTQFDLRAEVFRNGVFVGSSTTLCITGVTRNPDLAKVVISAFARFAAVPVAVGDILSLKLSTRIGTNPNGSKCSGPGGSHGSALGLRVYFDAVSRPARFSATFAP